MMKKEASSMSGAFQMKSIATTCAVFIGLLPANSAWAVISNTATVTATGSSGTVTADATEEVDVAAPVRALTQVSGSFSSSKDTDVAAGDTVTVSITMENTGNMTIYDVRPSIYSSMQGVSWSGTVDSTSLTNGSVDSDTTDDIVDELKPGDTITYTYDQPITQAHFDTLSSYTTTVRIAYAATDGGSQSLYDVNFDHTHTMATKVNTINVAKTGYTGGVDGTAVDGSTDNLPTGTVVTYEYLITNTGNTTLTNVALSDVHGGEGLFNQPNIESAQVDVDGGPENDTSTNSDGTNSAWDSLAPGDTLSVTTTYTITEDDLVQHQ